jgi:hypothetical protein
MRFFYLLLFSLFLSKITYSKEYPISNLETQIKATGSILNKPLTFNATHDITNTNNKTNYAYKEYKNKKSVNNLWAASLESLSDFPIIYVDDVTRSIVTDWITFSKSEKIKVTLHIKMLDINRGTLSVKIFTQGIRSSFSKLDAKKSQELENKIILRSIEISTYN